MAAISMLGMLLRREKHVFAGLHQGAELQVGVLGQETIDQRPVLRPQRALDVQHADARLDHQGHGGALIVFDDFFAGDRRHADRVGVPALDGGR